MVLDFSISNFRSIRQEQTLSFEATKDKTLEDYFVVRMGNYRILKIAAILGANASGKSNVLKAFYMLPRLMLSPAADKGNEIKYDKFALDTAAKSEPSRMTVNFIVADRRYCYSVEFDNRVVYDESLKCQPFDKKREHKVFDRTTDRNTLVAKIKWGDQYKSNSATAALEINLLHNRTVFGAYMKSNVNIEWMKLITDWLREYFMPMVTTHDQKLNRFVGKMCADGEINRYFLTEQMRKADVGIDAINIEKTSRKIPFAIFESIMNDDDIEADVKTRIQANPEISNIKITMSHVGRDGSVALSFKDESGGTQRYFELSGLLLKLVAEPHFLAIDELDCRLHPDLYSHFITTYLTNAGHSQLVFSTHQREFLKDRDSFRDDMVWITNKSPFGETELYSLADFDTTDLRESTSRYNAYTSGRLRGVPRLGDTSIDITSIPHELS